MKDLLTSSAAGFMDSVDELSVALNGQELTGCDVSYHSDLVVR